MAKISGIDVPELTFPEGTAPSTPASTKWKVYTKTDGLYYMDDAGTETGPLAASVAASTVGSLGYSEGTSNQTGITSITDVTGCSVTVTVAANRLIKISGYLRRVIISDSGSRSICRIKESTTNLGVILDMTAVGASQSDSASGFIILSAPSAGSHTYKLTAELTSGTGSVALNAAAASQHTILVEDIGPS